MGTLTDALRAATTAPPIEEAEAVRREYCEPRNAYERALHAAATAVLDGRLVVNIRATLLAGGTTAGTWTPALAIAPANAEQVRLRTSVSGRDQERCSFRGYQGSRPLTWKYSVDIPTRSLPYGTGSAIGLVPPLPPRVRAALPSGLDMYLVVWEAEWSQVKNHLPAPQDPAILEPLEPGSDLALVVATWDLSTLERAALEALGGS